MTDMQVLWALQDTAFSFGFGFGFGLLPLSQWHDRLNHLFSDHARRGSGDTRKALLLH